MSECYAAWSAGDHEWVGLCERYPSLSYLAPTAPEAITGIEALVSDVENEKPEVE